MLFAEYTRATLEQLGMLSRHSRRHSSPPYLDFRRGWLERKLILLVKDEYRITLLLRSRCSMWEIATLNARRGWKEENLNDFALMVLCFNDSISHFLPPAKLHRKWLPRREKKNCLAFSVKTWNGLRLWIIDRASFHALSQHVGPQNSSLLDRNDNSNRQRINWNSLISGGARKKCCRQVN